MFIDRNASRGASSFLHFYSIPPLFPHVLVHLLINLSIWWLTHPFRTNDCPLQYVLWMPLVSTIASHVINWLNLYLNIPLIIIGIGGALTWKALHMLTPLSAAVRKKWQITFTSDHLMCDVSLISTLSGLVSFVCFDEDDMHVISIFFFVPWMISICTSLWILQVVTCLRLLCITRIFRVLYAMIM